MHRRVAQITILAATCLLANKSHVRAQNTACPPRSAVASYDKKPSGPGIEIVDVVFTGSLQLPISDQDQIADSIKQQDYGDSLDGLIDDAVERVKAGWQDRGYKLRENHVNWPFGCACLPWCPWTSDSARLC